MLGKLFKYEFSAMGRLLLPIYGAVLLMSIISGLFYSLQPTSAFTNFTAIRVIAIITMVLYIVLIVAALVMSLVFAINRFKKNLLETEGYLTNTLPVKTQSHIFCKTVTAMVYQVIGAIAAGISGLAFATIICGAKALDFGSVFKTIGKVFTKYPLDATLFTVEAIIITLITLATINLMFYASMSVGYSINGKKSVYSVLCFVGFYIVEQIINSFVLRLFINASFGSDVRMIHPYLWVVIAVEVAYAVAYFFISRYFLSKKLNLQ